MANAGYATNSFNVVFIPSSWPEITASFQGIPINQAIGANMYPNITSMESSKLNWSPIKPKSEFTMYTSAITTIKIVPTLTAIFVPSEVPLVIASIVLL